MSGGSQPFVPSPDRITVAQVRGLLTRVAFATHGDSRPWHVLRLVVTEIEPITACGHATNQWTRAITPADNDSVCVGCFRALRNGTTDGVRAAVSLIEEERRQIRTAVSEALRGRPFGA